MACQFPHKITSSVTSGSPLSHHTIHSSFKHHQPSPSPFPSNLQRPHYNQLTSYKSQIWSVGAQNQQILKIRKRLLHQKVKNYMLVPSPFPWIVIHYEHRLIWQPRNCLRNQSCWREWCKVKTLTRLLLTLLDVQDDTGPIPLNNVAMNVLKKVRSYPLFTLE